MIHPELNETILTLVATERTRQDLKWGTQNHDPRFWGTILGEEFGEACMSANKLMWGDPDSAVKQFHYALECIETAAVAVAMVESLMRNLSDADFDTLCAQFREWEDGIKTRWQNAVKPLAVES